MPAAARQLPNDTNREPQTERRDRAMMVGGIIMVAVAPLALLGHLDWPTVATESRPSSALSTAEWRAGQGAVELPYRRGTLGRSGERP